MIKKHLSFVVVGLFLSTILFAGCSPKIYVIDRQTVFEEESAGSWPSFDKALIDAAKKSGPTAFFKVPKSARRERLFNVLNGAMSVCSVTAGTTANGAQNTPGGSASVYRGCEEQANSGGVKK